ncbi:adenylosuccinate synthetase [Candidatus Bathyarchaeota archaeon RBG_13_52_12]|nr:MAG: adenylosuccinate synthetase [Candidatus Bathyarchaeota archaeon RBG_13_52_12]
MGCTVVVDGFYGDTGKGKIISYLAVADDVAVVARAGVGPNAGHTVVKDGKIYKLRMVPCGFVNPRAQMLIGPGVLVNPELVIKEVAETRIEERFGIDPQCAVIELKHIQIDQSDSNLKNTVKTTGTGTGPCNADRVMRIAKMAREIPELKKYLADVPAIANKALDDGRDLLIEGTQGTFISLYYGQYPYVTSKDVCAAAACSDVGVGPTRVTDVAMVLKSYVTRVGGGELDGEISQEEAKIRGWDEYGTVTGRQRRAAPFDYNLARRAKMINGATMIALTKLDVLYPDCRGAKEYAELGVDAKKFVKKIENEVKVPVSLIGTGPSVDELIDMR